jgi:Ser/Thr protein kinase RdoA (MazF antagonist)
MTEKPKPSISEESGSKISAVWNLGTCTFTGIKFSENHTYSVQTESEKKYILRLSPDTHRSEKAIQAELDYVLLISRALTNPIVHLCTPISYGEEQHIAKVTPYDDNKIYFAVLFEYAKGSSCTDGWVGLKDDKLITSLGVSLATIHNITANKAVNPEKWDKMRRLIPDSTETHEGSSNIEKIKKRAEAGHKTSQMLAHLYEQIVEPFLKSLGEPTDATYGVVHGDLNVSNYFADGNELYIFDFDQVQMNWFGADVGVILQMSRVFDDMKWCPDFDGDRFRKLFLDAYKSVATGLVEAGHLEPEKLQGWEAFREFYHCSVAVDILFQAENGKEFETAITSFCEVVVKRFQEKYEKE